MRGVENTTAGERPDYHPAVNWRLAFHFLLQTTGLTPEDVANKVTRARDQANPAKYSAYKDFYKVLLEAEKPHWEGYLRERVRARGWDGEAMLTQLRKLPRSTPQAHRWFLLKIQLNGPMTKSRIAKAVKGVEAETCFVCRAAEDTISHLTECEGILEAYTRVQRGTGLPAAPGGMRTLMLQEDMDGGTRSALIAFYAAAWKTRHTCRRLEKTTTPDELADIIKTCLECPWLTYCTPTTTRKERRRGNLRPPKEVSTKCAVYRSDGASRRNGRGGSLAGMGAAYWAPGARGKGPPTERAREYLGKGVSNNVAEYKGLVESMTRAPRQPQEKEVVFEVDSMLLANHVGHTWACRHPTLAPLYEKCCELGDTLTENGVKWEIRHIYREYNQAADALSNEAIDEPEPRWTTAGW